MPLFVDEQRPAHDELAPERTEHEEAVDEAQYEERREACEGAA